MKEKNIKKAMTPEEAFAKIEELTLANETLRKSNEEINLTFSKIDDELHKIDVKGRNTSNSIQVHTYTDHKNISLWTRDGQRIGPLHPENAKKALVDFRRRGILLSIDQPNGAQVAAYQQTPEYKKYIKDLAAVRARKEESRKGGQMAKLIELMSKQYGLDKDQLSGVLPVDVVGKK